MIVLPAPASSASRKRRRGWAQHVLVDGDPLVRQRIDEGDFGREGRVEQVAVAPAVRPRRRRARLPDCPGNRSAGLAAAPARTR